LDFRVYRVLEDTKVLLDHRDLTVLSDSKVHKVILVLLEVSRVRLVSKELEDHRVIKVHRAIWDSLVIKVIQVLEVIKVI